MGFISINSSLTDKYKWSITKAYGQVTLYPDQNEYILSYYPSATPMTLSHFGSLTSDTSNANFVSYDTRDINTKEAKRSFAELYSLVRQKALGVDTVLDDIIAGDTF